MMFKDRIVVLSCVVMYVSSTYQTTWYCNSKDKNMPLILYIRLPTRNFNFSYHAFFSLYIVDFYSLPPILLKSVHQSLALLFSKKSS